MPRAAGLAVHQVRWIALHAGTEQRWLGISPPPLPSPSSPPCCCSGTGALDLLGLLKPLLVAATSPDLSLAAYSTTSAAFAAAPGGASGSRSTGSGGGQVVASGWHAAAVAARLCAAHPQLQDALVTRGLLPPLAQFVVAQAPAPPSALAPAQPLGGPGGDARRVAELLMASK